MKLRYLATIAAACAFAAAGCQEDLVVNTPLEELQVSNSYVGLPTEGGSESITVTATSSWYFYFDEEVTRPDWLTISTESGSAGETRVTFSADETYSNRTVELQIRVDDGDGNQKNDKIQYVMVSQLADASAVVMSTVAEVLAGSDGVTYWVRGTVEGIYNTTYGNYYLTDETGSILIYGTLDANGAEQNFSSLGIENGDIITVRGPRTTYGSTIELVNVTVLDITKSILSVEPTEIELEQAAGTFTFSVECAGEGLDITPANDWLSVTNISVSGTTYDVTVAYTANEDFTPRTGTIELESTLGSQVSNATVSVRQMGNVPDTTPVADALADLDGNYYALEGYVAAECTRGFIMTDNGTDFILIYVGSSYDEASYAPGDRVLVMGTGDIYNHGPQISPDNIVVLETGDGTYDHPEPVQLTAAELDAVFSEDIVKITYFTATGTPTGSYLNITVDGTDNVLAFYQRFSSMEVAEDVPVTVSGYYLSYQSNRLNFVATEAIQ